jgi:hypothetical protein
MKILHASIDDYFELECDCGEKFDLFSDGSDCDEYECKCGKKWKLQTTHNVILVK